MQKRAMLLAFTAFTVTTNAQALGTFGTSTLITFSPPQTSLKEGSSSVSDSFSFQDGSGFASADLSAGLLRSKITGATSTNGGVASAFLTDQLTFIGGVGTGLVHWSFDGALSPYNGSNATGFYHIVIASSYAPAINGSVTAESTNHQCQFILTCEIGAASHQEGVFSFRIIPLGTYKFEVTLNAGALGNATANFANTAHFSIELPAGITYKSASGLLLTVPEPSTYALSTAGLAFLLTLILKRSRRTNSANPNF